MGELETTVAVIGEKVTRNENDIAALKVSVEKIAEQNVAIIKLANSVENIAERMEGMSKDLNTLGEKFEDIKNAPAKEAQKNLSTFKLAVISALGGTTAGVIVTVVTNALAKMA